MTSDRKVVDFQRGEAWRDSSAIVPGHATEDSVNDGERFARSTDDMSARLVAVAERGDREAFAALVRHFAPRLKAWMIRGGVDAGKVDDVLQDVFAAVWSKATLYDSRRAGAAAWIFAIARNRRIDAFRRDRRPEFDPGDPAFRADPLPDGEQELAGRQRADAVRVALAALSEEQREILSLSFFEGESYAAIAIRLGIPLGTVKSRARLAFGRLRAELEPRREELR